MFILQCKVNTENITTKITAAESVSTETTATKIMTTSIASGLTTKKPLYSCKVIIKLDNIILFIRLYIYKSSESPQKIYKNLLLPYLRSLYFWKYWACNKII